MRLVALVAFIALAGTALEAQSHFVPSPLLSEQWPSVAIEATPVFVHAQSSVASAKSGPWQQVSQVKFMHNAGDAPFHGAAIYATDAQAFGSASRSRNTVKGAVIGAAAGFVIGAVLGTQLGTGCETGSQTTCSTSKRRRNLVLSAGGIGAGFGAVLGAGVGALRPTN